MPIKLISFFLHYCQIEYIRTPFDRLKERAFILLYMSVLFYLQDVFCSYPYKPL